MSLRMLDLVGEWERVPQDPPPEMPMFELVADDPRNPTEWTVMERCEESASRWITCATEDLLEVGP